MRVLFMFILGLLGLKQVLVLKQVAILYSQFSVGRVLADKNCQSVTVNPLSANGDRQQFSPNNIHTLSRDKVMRINKMITKGKMP